MGCHASTGGDPSGDNGVLWFRDPITGTEQICHIIANLESLRTFTWELLCHREELLSVVRIVFSESVVFHSVFWVSSFGMFFWFVFLFGIHDHWPKQWNELIKQISKQIGFARKSASETREPFRIDQGEGSTDDVKNHLTRNNTGRKVLWNMGNNVQMPESWRAQAT